MALQITPLTKAFGAIVEGISLAEPLQSDQEAAIKDALLQYQVRKFGNFLLKWQKRVQQYTTIAKITRQAK